MIQDNERINDETRIGEDARVRNDENIHLLGKDLNITKPQLITVVLLCANFLISSACYSLLAPFFPLVAVEKQISKTQVGIIFGVFELVLLVLSPIFGKYIQLLGIRFLFVSGLFISSGSMILFGLLEKSPNGTIYFVMCVLCRIVTAIGASMSLSYAIVGIHFPNKLSTIVATLEICSGCGFMIGPLVGGIFYQIGGFALPFFVLGGTLFLLFLISFFTFPDSKQSESREKSTLKFFSLLKIPTFFMTLILAFVGSFSIGFFQPSMEIHLAPFNLNPIKMSLILLSPSLLYMIASPIFGYFSDKFPKSTPWSIFACGLTSGLAYSFLGPIPLFNLKLNLTSFLVGFIFYGFTISGFVIPTYSELNKISRENGYPNDLQTQGIISGIFSCTWSLGALVGPMYGGFVVEVIGFEKASLGVVMAFILSTSIYGLFNCHNQDGPSSFSNSVISNQAQVPNENTPLLI